MRRRTTVLLSLLVATAVVTGLSIATASASVGAAKAPACAGKTKKKAIAAIKKTWDIFLNGTTGRALEERSAVVEGAEDPVLFKIFTDTFAANAEVAATTTAQVNKVKCKGKKAADVAYDLVLAGTVSTGLAPPGEAVIVDGQWKVSTGTVCDLVSLANPAVLESGPCAV